MKNSKAAVRYALALLSLATEKQVAAVVLDDVRSIDNSIKSSEELNLFLSSPVVTGEKKAEILKELFKGKLNDLTIEFLGLISKKDRANILQAVTRSYEEEYRKANNIVMLYIESAVMLDESNIAVISKKLAPAGATVEVKQIINPDLIGGFIARIGDVQIDNSILSTLKRLKTEFQSKY